MLNWISHTEKDDLLLALIQIEISAKKKVSVNKTTRIFIYIRNEFVV
jgi:hypothetical protein